MADIFDERRRGLEEDYFRRRDRESLQRLREHLRSQSQEGGAPATLDCPRCAGKLREESFDEVTIDRCDTCNGIWLDAGELENIVGQEKPAGHWLRAFWPGRTKE